MSSIQRHRLDTEEGLNKSLSALKCQLEEDARIKAHMQGESAKSVTVIANLRSRIGDLEGQVRLNVFFILVIKVRVERITLN